MDEAAPSRDDVETGMTDLDLRGLKCPMPVLRTRRALRRLPVGHSLRVLCTDPLAGIDIPNLVREEGQRLARASTETGVAVFVIVKTCSRDKRCSRDGADPA